MTLTRDESFDILGVPRDADEQAVHKAYRKLAMQYHPDREGGDAATFLKINQAHAVLNPKKDHSGLENVTQDSGYDRDMGNDSDDEYNPLAFGNPFLRPAKEGLAQTAWMISLGFQNEPLIHYWSYAHGHTRGDPIPRPPELMNAKRGDLYRENGDGTWTRIDRAPSFVEQYNAYMSSDEKWHPHGEPVPLTPKQKRYIAESLRTLTPQALLK